MPDARTHDTIAILTAIPLAPLAYSLLTFGGDSPERAAVGAAWVIGAHLVGSYWLSPDLDIDGSIDDRWGPLFWIWRPYMWVVPHRHRILSHSGFSALLRLGYLYGVILLLLGAGSVVAGWFDAAPDRRLDLVFRDWFNNLVVTHRRESTLIAIGAVCSDLVHTIADHLSTRGKRFLRFFGIRVTRDYTNHDRPRSRARRRRRAW